MTPTNEPDTLALSQAPPANLAALHLLVLDDEAGFVNFIARVATKAGWSVQTAVEGQAFRERFRAAPADLVMLDLQLGAADGVEQLRFLAEQAYGGQIALISGFDRRVLEAAQQVGTALGLRIVALLEKPALSADVLNVLRIAAAAAGRIEIAGAPHPAHGARPPLAADQLIGADVGRALANGELSLFLQPVVSASSGELLRFEALCRWHHPVLGMIPPDLFIRLAERDDEIIDRLTMWVVEDAIHHHKRLAAAIGALPLSVNVSAANIQRLDFPDRVAASVAGHGAAPTALIFEITESVAMRNAALTVDILTRLRLKGFGLAMDDFGTGYSSLKALRQMPFSELKIDKSFVMDMATSRDCQVIVKSVADLARNMGLETVAEGVETEEAERLLVGYGVTALQGYRLARPMPVDQAVAWAQDRQRRARPAG